MNKKIIVVIVAALIIQIAIPSIGIANNETVASGSDVKKAT